MFVNYNRNSHSMKIKLSLFLTVMLSACLSSVFSQTITVVSVTESRCAASGSVSLSVSPSAGSSDLWRITSAPAEYIATLSPPLLPSPFQNGGDFFSLPAGTYNFEYSNGISSVFETGVVVPGTYVDPIFTIDTVLDAICPGQGEIHVSMTQGNDPYRYRLLSPDSLPGNYTAWQTSGIFTGLRAETYAVQAEDSCGVIKTISGIVINHPSGGPMWYDYNGNTQVYYSDEARSIPQNCTQATVGVYLYRNYLMQQKRSLLRDGDGNVISDIYSTTEKPLELVGGQAPYSFTLTESEAHYFLPEPTDSFNDYRPSPPFSSATSASGTLDSIGIVFDVANDLTIYSLGYVGDRSGTKVRLELYDNAGTLLYSKWEEQDINAGNDNLASLGWFVPAGTGYRLVKRTSGYLENHTFTSSPYPISAGDITVTGPAGGTNLNWLYCFTSVVYSQNTTPLQGPSPIARFSNVPRTSANSYTIVGTDACGSKIYRSVTTKLPLENLGVRRTAAECSVGNDVLTPNRDFYTIYGLDKAKHYYTWPWIGNDVQGTLPYTYTVTSDIGYSPAPITTDLALLNSVGVGAYYDETRLRNLDGSQWQPDPASTITVNLTDACGETLVETFGPPSGNIPIENITNYYYDNTACAPWKRYRIYHLPYVDTFENFTLNIQTLTPGGAHARIQPSGTGFQVTEYNWFQGFVLRGNQSAYPHFLPGTYEISFTGNCSGVVVKDTITITPSSFEFDARVIQPCSNTPTARIEITRPGGTSVPTSGAYYVYAGAYNPSTDYSVEPFLQEVPYASNPQFINGLAPGTYTVIFGTRNGSYKFMNNCTFHRTVTVISYKDPQLTLTADPVCNPNTTGNIYANVVDGVGPFTYQIRVQGEPIDSFLANSQTSPIFTAKMDTNYDVRVIDSCGQSTVASISTGGLFMPPIQSADTFCVGSELRIETIAVPGASYTWRKAGTAIPGAPDSNVFIIPNAVLADSGLYSVITVVSPCVPDTGFHRVSMETTTNLATALAAPDRFCEGDGDIVLLGGNTDSPTITTGLWTIVSGPNSPLSPSIGSLVNNSTTVTDIVTTDGSPENPYIFRWEIDNGTCVSNAYDTVFVHRKPTTSYAGPDQFLCEASGATLSATAVSFGFGYWTQISGNPVTIADSTDPGTSITFSGSPIWPDTIVMQWNVVNDSANATCTSEGRVTLYNISSTGRAIAGMDDTSCNDLTYQLNALPVAADSGSGRWLAYSFPGVSPTFNNATLPNAIANLSISGEYVFVWEVSNGVCPPNYDTVKVFLIKADAGNDIIVCTDNVSGIRMQGDTVPGIPGTWSSSNPSLTWTPNGVAGSDTALISGISAGRDTIVYTVTEGSCTVTDELILLASNPPSISMAGPDQLGLCQDSAILRANIPVEGTGVWTQVSGPNTAIQRDFDSAVNIVEGLIIGTYEFVWTISNQPCSPERDTVVIQVTRLPHSTTIFDVENPYCLNKGSITAQAIPNGTPSNYEFSIDSATGGYQPSGIFSNLDTGTYYVWSRDILNNACVARTVMPVVLVDTLARPSLDTTYFTPVRVCNGQTTRGSIHVRVSGGQGPITYQLTGSFSATNNSGDFTNLLAGTYSIQATDSLGCPLTIISSFDLPELSCERIITIDSVVCVDTIEMPNGPTSVTGCDGNSPTTTANGGTVVIDPATGCVTITSDFSTSKTDTTCIIVCDTILGVWVCDTTTIITVNKPTPDTTVTVLPPSGSVTVCADTSELTSTTINYLSCRGASAGTFTRSSGNCFTYIPLLSQIDTTCVISCDDNGICDTSVFVFIPSLNTDSVITTEPVICLDTTEMPAGHQTITGCDGSSPASTSNGGTASIDPVTGCVTITADFTTSTTDTTCVIVCDTVNGICDTTIIVSVNRPTIDTVVLPTNGNPTNHCISTNELIGSSLTYRSCGAPSYGVFANTDTCYNYIPVVNRIDTACAIVCDEFGICDTTVFIYVPPVTNDTVVTRDSVVCVDTNELIGATVDSISTCDGTPTTRNGGSVAIDATTGCVSISPDFSSGITDTTCVVVCKSVAGTVICDTTIIITVQPPTIDTIIQLTNGNPTNECLTQDELAGTRFTYSTCGNPIQGVLTVANDTCFTYTPINDRLDTSCVVICDEFGMCDTTVFIYVPPVTKDTIYTLDSTVCVDTTEMPASYQTVTGCDGNSPTTTSNGGTVSINANGCVTISPVFTSRTDTTCIVICDTVLGICDTTLIVSMRRATPDTIIECIPRDGMANDSAMNTMDLLGSVATKSVFKLPKHGQFILTNDTNSSYQTSPFPVLDTVQVSFCDEYNFCDTFTFIYIPPMRPDTLYTQGGGVVCVDSTEMPRGTYTSIGTCDGMNMTSNGGTVSMLSGGCVDITPDFSTSRVDTTCVVLCDTVLPMCECDTTYIISFAPANTDTFAIQLPRGTNTADTCLTTEDLFGNSYTYRRLGAPAPHGPVTTHNDTCINYVQTSTTKYLDTARVLICDEYGNCDTTVIIYVPAPDPDTLLVGPVIPSSNADTCVRLEATFMTGHHIGTCDGTGTTSLGVPVTFTGLCVSYPVSAPIFTGDTACIIVCDTVRNIVVCDTTLIVYLPDTTPPTVVCKDDTVYLDNFGTVTIDTSNVVSSITDNTLINSVWVTPTNFNCTNVGLNSVTLYAVDTNRNIDSCVATITVLDTVPPIALCQNVTIQLDSNGNASISAVDLDAGSTDNCAIASLSINQTSFDCSHIGSNTVVLTVTDVNGNVSTCSATVTVQDNIAPIVYCPGNKEVVLRNTTCEFVVPDYRGEVSAWDNCLVNGITFTQSPGAGSIVNLENTDTVITITATDGINSSTCSFVLSARCVKELNIPQFISPNSDGKNDTWEIPELANYPRNVVKLFNRWGNLVFEQKGYSTGWNGRSNVDNGVNRLIDNKQLPEGTYYYIIDLGTPNSEPYVGYMQIKR